MSLWARSYYAVFLLEGKETSQQLFLVKASWHAPLICPLNEGKKEGRKIGINWEQSSKSCRTGIRHWHWRLRSSTPSVPLCQHQLRLELAQLAGQRMFSHLDGAGRTLLAAGDGWGKEIMGPNCTLEFSKLSCTVHINKINFISPAKPSSTSQVDIFRFQTVLKTVCWDS